MWEAFFEVGRKVGTEHYLREDGTPFWVKKYASDGTWTWDNYDRVGRRVATSHWRGKTLLNSDVPDPPVRKKGDKLPEPDGL
jgi:hypothetical protein